MKLGDGLFLNTCREIAQEYKESGIAFDDMSEPDLVPVRAPRNMPLKERSNIFFSRR
jgi:hypothetical protein